MKQASRLLVVAAVTLAACGGSDSGSGAGTCTPSSSATVTINAGGLSPQAVCVRPGGSVTFVNADTQPHDIESTGGCPELNLGVIAPAGRKVARFDTAQTCTFHDAANPANASFQGTVAVSEAQVEGPGY
jgi:plastocyanin